jgi:peroxiredoxin
MTNTHKSNTTVTTTHQSQSSSSSSISATLPIPTTTLPPNLPIPIDDGAAHHLLGLSLLPSSLTTTATAVVLKSTSKQEEYIDLAKFDHGYVVLYCYPMTAQPGLALPDTWDTIPGARGCTPQSCAFRDHYQELKQHCKNITIFGISTQSAEEQIEAKIRLHLPFELLSDSEGILTQTLNLPTFQVDGGNRLLKRLTMILQDGTIRKVFYPVFPPDQNAHEVMEWLQQQQQQQK